MNKPNTALVLLAVLPLASCANDLAFLKTSSKSTPPAELQEESVKVDWFKAGFYAGVKVGRTQLDAKGSEVDSDLAALGYSTTTTLEDDDSTFNFYGGYRFVSPFSVEIGWVNLGRVESTIAPNPAPANLNNFLASIADVHPFLGEGLSVKGLYHLVDQDRFQLGASLGGWIWDVDVDAEAAGGGAARIDESGVDLLFGLQGQLALGNGISAVASWERFMLDDNDADTFWLGIQGTL